MKEIHLMYKFTPFSACGRYVGKHKGMKQTFEIDKITCKLCLGRLKEYKETVAYQRTVLNEA